MPNILKQMLTEETGKSNEQESHTDLSTQEEQQDPENEHPTTTGNLENTE